MRLCADTFTLRWVEVPYEALAHEAAFVPIEAQLLLHHSCQCFCSRVEAEFAVFYSNRTEFKHPRVQSWLRKAIRDAVILRGNEVLLFELHRIEGRVGLFSKSMSVKHLKKAYGCCYWGNSHIDFDVALVLLPPGIREEVMVHELCHLVVHSHSKKFWRLHSEKLGRDAQLSKLTTDCFFSRYYRQIHWLLK